VSDWNAEHAAHKMERRTPAPDRGVKGGKNRKPKKWKVVRDWLGREVAAYHGADEAACIAWIEKQARSYYVRRQDKSPRALDEAAQRSAESAKKYRIVPPAAS